MNDTLLFFSSPMSKNSKRIREIKYHINQLLTELYLIEPNNKTFENFQPFNLTINSSLTTISHEKCLFDNQCPYLSCKQAILHSTTYDEYKKVYQKQKKTFKISPKKNLFLTSTPKTSSNENILLKPYLTSTPRRNKHQSTDIIPLKRLLYNNKDSNRQRHSTKRSIVPRRSSLIPIDENYPQWI
ncbi:unnamed protein product [Adineta steineri]|uniref:Uncharacterized protein n=1 Tax=Adineta steineri TaxID=433720 RepID=A0A818IQM6_9BILA|nr:unnamed protein product [Adineta steineri]